MATRRDFLIGASAACLTLGMARASIAPRLVSAAKCRDRDGGVLWSADRLVPFDLPARGHAPVHLADGRVLVMGRRPGLYASMIDTGDLGVKNFAPSKDARFAGHAASSSAVLVTSEFDATSFAASLVARDPGTGAERGRWPLGGIEPHEVVFAGDRLAVALGGLIKDGGVAGPAFNPGGIDSAVLEVDPKTGRVLARHKIAEPTLSLRHLAVHGDTVAVAAQDQDITLTRPLVAVLRRELEFVSWPDPRDCDFRGYIGSIAIDRSGTYIAAASPRGGVLGVWSLESGAWLGGLAISDVCGVTAAESGFWASSGLGDIVKIAAEPSGPSIETRWQVGAGFDNHLLLI
jgi:hypothetical protein